MLIMPLSIRAMFIGSKNDHLLPFLGQLKGMVNAIFDWILPPVCPVTGEIVDAHGMIASPAWQELRFISDPHCMMCGIPFDFEGDKASQDSVCGDCIANPKPYKKAASALVYNEGCRDLILKFKHGDRTQAVRVFLPWLMQSGSHIIGESDVIIPVPLHRMRLIKRKYNQAALLAQAIAVRSNIPCVSLALRRVRATSVQGKLGARARRVNVLKAFDLQSTYDVKGLSVLLVDDVLTSGATVEACTNTLLDSGAKSVNVLTVARALRN